VLLEVERLPLARGGRAEGGRSLFGMGKVDGLDRRTFNSRIRDLLEQRIGIETDNCKNPRFPGVLAFGRHLDTAWYNKVNPDWAALSLAVAYLDGCTKAGDDAVAEACRILGPVSNFLAAVRTLGKVPEDKLGFLATHVAECAERLGSRES
jgi:hypothetical protein